LTIAIVCTQTIRIFSDVGRPFIGFITFYNPHTPGWIIDGFTPDWWTPEYTYMNGAKLEFIDGISYNEHSAINYFQTAFDRGQKTIRVVFWHNLVGHTTRDVPIQQFTLSQAWDVWAAKFLLSAGLLILAWESYRAAPESYLCEVMAVTATWGALVSGIDRPSLFWHDGWLSTGLSLMLLVIPAFAASSIIDFSLLFPIGQANQNHWLRLSIWGFRLWMISAGLAHLFSTLTMLSTGNPTPTLQLDEYGYRTATIGMAIAIVTQISRPLYIYTRERRWRRRLSLIFVAALPSVPLFILAGLQRLRGVQVSLYSSGIDLRYLMLLIPLSVAYLILRYQTFRPASRFLLNVPILAVAGMVANFIQAILRPMILTQGVWDIPVFSVIFGVVALSIWIGLMQTHLKNGIVWLLNHNSLGYQEIREFNEALTQAETEPTYEAQTTGLYHLIESLAHAVKVNYAAIWVLNDDCTVLSIEGEYAVASIPNDAIAPIDIMPWTLTPHDAESLPLVSYSQRTPNDTLKALLVGAAEVCIPLRDVNSVIGMVTLGHRYDNDIFDANEINVIRVILSWMALYLRDQRGLRLLREAEEAQHQMRKEANNKLDNILHDIIGGPMRRIRQDIDLAINKEANEFMISLQQRIGYMQQMVNNFRTLTHIIEPQSGLGKDIAIMCNRFNENQAVEYQGDENLRYPIPPILYQELFIIATELLNNALTHAHAQKITVSLNDHDGMSFTLIVADDGRGSSEVERAKAASEGHHGVQSLAKRFIPWNGQVTYESAPNAGTRIAIHIPYPRL